MKDSRQHAEFLAKKIRVLPTNRVYRLGNVICCLGARWSRDAHTVLHDPAYKHSLLYEYLLARGEGRAIVDTPLLKQILQQYAERNSIREADDEVLLHIRCGDVIDQPRKINLLNIDRVLDSIDYVITTHTKRIVIISAMHYGANNPGFNYSNQSYEKNIKHLIQLITAIQLKYNIPVEVDEVEEYSDIELIDYHFAKLATCNNTILDKGTFDALIRRLKGTML